MRLWQILESIASPSIQIIPVSYDEDAFYNSDGYSIWEQAYAIASNSGIYIASNKELTYIAAEDYEPPRMYGNVVGAVWSAIYRDDDQDANVYDFDMAIAPQYRNQVGVFLRLMDAALGDYRDLKAEDPRTYIRVWVVNARLASVLERRYDFELEAQHGNHSCHMVYYGD